MASGVKVTVTDRAIISALNTPGGDVYRWRDEVGREVKAIAEEIAPINNPMNAEHRGGEVGTYQASFGFDRRGSSGHHVVARVTNSSDHADIVEFGRSSSSQMQIFSWTEFGGAIVRVGGPGSISKFLEGARTVQRRQALEAFASHLPEKIGKSTQAREGYHVLSRALVGAMGAQGISARVDA
jgi:hypothetical protein